MACKLYREGFGTIEHGIECESVTVEPHYLDSMLNDGWSVNPPGYVAPDPVLDEPEDGKEEITFGPDLHERMDAMQEENELMDKLIVELESENSTLKFEVDRLTEELLAAAYVPNSDDPAEEIPAEEIRDAAKAAGIEGWDTKRISTLKKALEA